MLRSSFLGCAEPSKAHHLHHVAAFLGCCNVFDRFDSLSLLFSLLLGFLLLTKGGLLFSDFGETFLKVEGLCSGCFFGLFS